MFCREDEERRLSCRLLISSFACNFLHGVTVHLFYPLTLYLNDNIRDKIYSNNLHFLSYLLKCPVDNAGNSISEPLDLKIFLGKHAPQSSPPNFRAPLALQPFPLCVAPSKSHATSLKSIIQISKTCFSRRFQEAISQFSHYQPETFMVQIRTGNVLKRSLLL